MQIQNIRIKYNKYRKKISITILKRIAFFTLLSMLTYGVHAQTIDYEVIQESQARFDFYQGVNLLNSGFITESLTAFQRAISIQDLPVYQYMFSRANMAYGLVDASVNVYRLLLANNFEQTLLQSKLEILQSSAANPSTSSIASFVRSISIDLSQYGYNLPMNIRVLNNGDLTLAFLQSNDVVVLSPTGKVKLELASGVLPIMHPTDVLFSSESIFLVPTFSNDDLLQFSTAGVSQGSFIKKKNENGDVLPFMNDFSGPQFITEDSDNNIYVSAYGSARVFKFNSKGEYILDFGVSTSQFMGLQYPTGIDILGDKIYVADYPLINNRAVAILYEFDKSGNYLQATALSTSRIETVRKINETQLLLTSNDAMLIFEDGKVLERLTQTEFKRLTSATFDKNDMLWVVDQGRNRLESYTNLYNQYSGLNANILSIDAVDFPKMSVKLKVNNISGSALVGLDADSFVLYENNVTVNRIELLEHTTNPNSTQNIILLPSIESLQDPLEKQNVIETVEYLTSKGEELLTEQGKNIKFWLLETAQIPQYSVSENTFSRLIVESLLKYQPVVNDSQYLPLTIRFALNTLLLQEGEKKIVFLGTPPKATTQDTLQWEQIRNILDFHGINFMWIDDSNVLDPNNRYLETLLTSNNDIARKYVYFDNLTFDNIFNSTEPGLYTITFNSLLKQNFDKNFIPLNIEVHFFSRSGNDLAGYVIPGWEQ